MTRDEFLDLKARAEQCAKCKIESLDACYSRRSSRITDKEVLELVYELEQVRKERDGTIADIPHRCWKCKHSRCNAGNECEIAHYTGTSPDCQSWEWQGLDDGEKQ